MSKFAGLPGKLIKDGLMSQSDVEKVLEKSRDEDISFVSYLVSKKLLSSEKIALAATEECGIPLIDIEAVDIDPEIISLIDENILKKHNTIPLFKRGKSLYVAISDPSNLSALDDIRYGTKLLTEAILARHDHLSKRVEKAIKSFKTDSKENIKDDEFIEFDDIELFEDEEIPTVAEEEAPVVKFVNKMLLDALKIGASDLHFEPYEFFYRVRFSIDGVLKQVAKPPLGISKKLAARVKIMSRLDVSERRVPQDGRIKLHLNANKSIDFRVSTCPTLWGEKIFMRILDSSAANLNIDLLGYEDDQKKLYLEALNSHHGIILATGPAGTGKTVSLYTGIGILNKESINISTIEDLVEIKLPGINQIQVDEKTGMTCSKALRTIIRQSVDVVLVGEIRDYETLSIAMRAARQCLVMSALHISEAPQALTRLMDMGMKTYDIAEHVKLVMAQRLCRRLCSCKVEHELPNDILLSKGFKPEELPELKLYKANYDRSCERCGGEGYKGRVGIHQVMPISEEMKKLILKGCNASELAEQARNEGIADLRQSGLKKVKQGITSLEEFDRVVP